jgi:hypothetical protein
MVRLESKTKKENVSAGYLGEEGTAIPIRMFGTNSLKVGAM